MTTQQSMDKILVSEHEDVFTVEGIEFFFDNLLSRYCCTIRAYRQRYDYEAGYQERTELKINGYGKSVNEAQVNAMERYLLAEDKWRKMLGFLIDKE